jgi:hypothetical protein
MGLKAGKGILDMPGVLYAGGGAMSRPRCIDCYDWLNADDGSIPETFEGHTW